MAPLLSLKYMEAMGPCRFVGGSVSRLGIPYAWALPLLTTCRHLPHPAYQSGRFFQSSAHMAPSTLSPATSISSTYRPLAARKLTRRRFVFGGTASENLCATAPASLRYQIADVSGPPSSLRPGAPRIWTHLTRICKKQMEKDHKWKTNNCFLNES